MNRPVAYRSPSPGRNKVEDGFHTADSNSRTRSGFDSDRICECLVMSINYTNGNTYLLPGQNIYYTRKIFITWTKYLLPGQTVMTSPDTLSTSAFT